MTVVVGDSATEVELPRPNSNQPTATSPSMKPNCQLWPGFGTGRTLPMMPLTPAMRPRDASNNDAESPISAPPSRGGSKVIGNIFNNSDECSQLSVIMDTCPTYVKSGAGGFHANPRGSLENSPVLGLLAGTLASSPAGAEGGADLMSIHLTGGTAEPSPLKPNGIAQLSGENGYGWAEELHVTHFN